MKPSQIPPRQVPALEVTLRQVGEEIVDKATALADLAASLAKDLHLGQ